MKNAPLQITYNPKNFNLTYLLKLANGDHKFLVDILKTINKAIQSYGKKIIGYENQKNIEKVKFNLHKLQTPINSLGVKTLNDSFMFVETYEFQKSNFDDFKNEVLKITNQSNVIVNELESLISYLKSL